MHANLMALPIEQLKREVELAFNTAWQTLAKEGVNLSREEAVRLATQMVTANQMLMVANTATVVINNLMEAMATPGAPTSKERN
jgi:hypothetical protein